MAGINLERQRYMSEGNIDHKPAVTTRRAILKTSVAGLLGIVANNLPGNTPPASAEASLPIPELTPAQTLELTNQFIAASEKFGGINTLGARISNAFPMSDGIYIAFQGGILQKAGDTIQPWNTLDEMHNQGFDADLANGNLGVKIPPKDAFDDHANNIEGARIVRYNHFGVPPQMIEHLKQLKDNGFDVGVCTAPGENFGSYTEWRFQRMAYKQWNDGKIERELIGDAVKQTGKLIPKNQLLSQAEIENQVNVTNSPAKEIIASAVRQTKVSVDVKATDPTQAEKTKVDAETVARVLNLGSVVKEIIIVDPNDDQLKHSPADNEYGSLYEQGEVHGIIYPAENGASVVYLGSTYTGRGLAGFELHEMNHGMDIALRSINYLMDAPTLASASQKRDRYFAAYTKRVLNNNGKSDNPLDGVPLYASAQMYGQEIWKDFLTRIGETNTIYAYNLKQLQEKLANPNTPSFYKEVMSKYITIQGTNDIPELFSNEGLGNMLMLLYWQNASFAEMLPTQMAARLKEVANATLQKAALEFWAEEGKELFLDPTKAKDFPELYDAISFNYQLAAGKTIKQASKELNKLFTV